MRGSAELTTRVLREFEEPDFVLSPEKRAVNSEHGATIGLMARTLTAMCVEMDDFSEDEATANVIASDRLHEAQKKYDEAHLYLARGNNGYYRTSNAVNAARHERLAGNRVKALRWMGRGAVGLAWSLVHDRSNAKQSILTFGDKLIDLRSKNSAAKSVVKRP